MESIDLFYLFLKKGLSGVNYGKDVVVTYDLDNMVVDVGIADYVVISFVHESSREFDYGNYHWYKNYVVAVDIRSADRTRFGLLKMKVESLLGDVYEFCVEGDPVDIGGTVVYVNHEGAFVDHLVLADTSIISEGDYVEYDDGVGWVFWIDETHGKDVYVFKREGQYFLIIPSRSEDLSNTLRGLFRVVIDVSMQGIIKKL